MIIQFSPFAYNVIQHYKNCLMLSKYHCTEERANGKAQEMVDYIIGKVQECPYVKLGKKNGAKGNAFNKMLKWFQYKVSANNAWGVSVLYDENGNALVYRIVHCSYLKEPSPGWKQQTNASQQDKQEANESAKWIPIQDFNKQIQQENTMKWKRIYNESSDVKFVILKTSHSFTGCVKLVFDSLEQAAAFVVYQITNEDDMYDKRARRKMYKTLLDYRHYQDEDNEYNIWEVKPPKDDYVQYI